MQSNDETVENFSDEEQHRSVEAEQTSSALEESFQSVNEIDLIVVLPSINALAR
jgi:hypothetical protein